jgi:hypothetical protein
VRPRRHGALLCGPSTSPLDGARLRRCFGASIELSISGVLVTSGVAGTLKGLGRVMITVFLAVLGLTALVCSSGIDRWTTLDPWSWSYPLRAAVGAGSALAFAILVIRSYFFPPADTVLPEEIAQLKRDNPDWWFLRGLMATAVLAIIVGWACVRTAGVGAQYLGGREDSFDATVTSLYARRGRSACTGYVTVRRDSDAGTLQICLVTWYRHTLATGLLEVDRPVTIRVVRTPLGVVVKSVEPR